MNQGSSKHFPISLDSSFEFGTRVLMFVYNLSSQPIYSIWLTTICIYMYGMYKYRCICICILLLCFDQRITLCIPPGENQNFAVDFSGSDGRLKSIGDTVRVVSTRFVYVCVKFTNHAVKKHCQPRCRLKTEIEQQF